MSEPPEEQMERATDQLVDHMRAQLQVHGMDASDEAVRAACRERLRSWLAMQALAGSSPAVD
jgi:hypothetical protein